MPALVFLLLRIGVPESPRWLVSAGRVDKAREVVRKCLGPDVDFDAMVAEAQHRTSTRGSGLANIVTIFRRGYGGPLVFCSVFWICQVAPSFAVRTYQPKLLESFGVTNELGGSVLIMLFPILGIAFGVWAVNAIGRRLLLLSTFVIFTAAFAALSIVPPSIAAITIALFILYHVSEAAGSSLQSSTPTSCSRRSCAPPAWGWRPG